MNAFFVPQLGSQIYTMNGMATQLSLQADHAGVYRGQSSQFSGDGFAGMTFPVHAVAPEAFDRWVADARAHGGALNAAAYVQLARPTRQVPPATFAAVQPGLFEAILRQDIPPHPGPTVKAREAGVSPESVR
jgi:cytochrome o ubiquinol oxidase subunit 2